MKKNIITAIVGPTSTGKTKFALKLAQEQLESQKNISAVNIISADSRQVYKHFETISGADIPAGFKRCRKKQFPHCLFQDSKLLIKIHGQSIINPDEEWSLAHYLQFARSIIKYSIESNESVIIVGGTGLYHNNLLNFDPNITIKPNSTIRKQTKNMSVEKLQDWLKKINIPVFKKMNNSDSNNSRRLIRAIEISIAKEKNLVKNNNSGLKKLNIEIKTIKIEKQLNEIKKSIKKRVEQRFNSQTLKQIEMIRKKFPNLTLQAASSMGFKEMSDYLDKKINMDGCKKSWIEREFKYAKRQITWFKKK